MGSVFTIKVRLIDPTINWNVAGNESNWLSLDDAAGA